MTTRRNLFKLAVVAPVTMMPGMARAERVRDALRPPEGAFCPQCDPAFLLPYPRMGWDNMGPWRCRANTRIDGVQRIAVQAGHGWIAEVLTLPQYRESDPYGRFLASLVHCPVCGALMQRVVWGDVVLDYEGDYDADGMLDKRMYQL